MTRRILAGTHYPGPLAFPNGDVEFSAGCVVEGDLMARKVTAIGRLWVKGVLTCDELAHAPKQPVRAGRLILAGEDLGGEQDGAQNHIADEPAVLEDDGSDDGPLGQSVLVVADPVIERIRLRHAA